MTRFLGRQDFAARTAADSWGWNSHASCCLALILLDVMTMDSKADMA